MEPENYENNGYRPDSRWLEHAALAFALILIFFAFAMSGTSRSRLRNTETDVSNIYAGDWNLKVYLLVEYTKEQGINVPSHQVLSQALTFYNKAAQAPSPAALRRAGVLTYELKGTGALEYLGRLDSPKVVEDLPKQDVARLQNEVRMWFDIYDGELSAREVDDYAERIRRLNLGPTRAFALKHLYIRADRNQQVAAVMREAQERALSSLIPTFILFFALFITGLLGAGLAIFFAANRERWFKDTGPRPVRGANGTEGGVVPARILFRAFTIYLGSILVLSITVGAALSQRFNELPAETRLLSSVALQFGLSVASGMIGLAALYLMLRRVGANLDSVGLTLRDLRTNALWGLAGFAALLPIVVIVNLFSQALTRLLFRDISTPAHPIFPMLLSGDRTVFLLVFIIGAVLAPFFEEIFFRGLLYNGLRERLGVKGAVLISAAAFAIVHPQLPAGFLPIVALGAVFALLVEVRRSLVPSMLAHALNNGVIFLMLYFAFIL